MKRENMSMPCQQNQSTKDYLHPMHCNWCFYPAKGKKCSEWPECLFKISPHAETRNVRTAPANKQRRRTAYTERPQRSEVQVGPGGGIELGQYEFDQ